MPGRGMSNEPNWAGRGVGGHSPPYGIVGETPARRRDDLSPRAESPEMSNKPNLPRFLAENEGRRENKANPSGGEARHWGFRIADCRFAAVEAWNAGAWNVKRTQLGETGSRRARPALPDARRNAGRSGQPSVAASRGPGMSNKPNLRRFGPKTRVAVKTKPVFARAVRGARHQCYRHRQAGACRCHPGAGGGRGAPLAGCGEPGMSNKANLRRISGFGLSAGADRRRKCVCVLSEVGYRLWELLQGWWRPPVVHCGQIAVSGSRRNCQTVERSKDGPGNRGLSFA